MTVVTWKATLPSGRVTSIRRTSNCIALIKAWMRILRDPAFIGHVISDCRARR